MCSSDLAHILEGYLIALDNLDEVIALIRSSRDPDVAKAGLISRFGLSEIQAKAILEMRLQRLTGLEREKIQQEYKEVMELIAWLKDVLSDEGKRMGIIKDELGQIREKYGDQVPSMIASLCGPSRTADIEKTLVTPAHGPEEIHVFLIDDPKKP